MQKGLRLNTVGPFILFAVLSLLFSIAAYYPFVYYGKAFLWGTDGINQHIQTLRFTRDWVASLSQGEASFWSLQLGFGEGTFANSLHFRLINFLCCLFPEQYMELFLVVRTFLYQLFAGFAFIAFAKTLVEDDKALVLGALAYSFSAYTLYFGARHAFFIEMMVFFPLMCCGIHGLLHNGRSLLLVIVVAIAGISYVYFLLMVTLPALAYAVALYFEMFDRTQRSIRHFLQIVGKGTIHFMVGVLLAAFSLLPQLIALFSSARIGTAELGNPFFWDIKFYYNLFQGFIGIKEFGIYGYIAISGPCFVSIVSVLASDGKQHSLLRRQLLWCLLVLCIPILTMAFSGFAGKTERWCFVVAFWNACSLSVIFPSLQNGTARAYMPKALTTAAILLIIHLLLLMVGGGKPSISAVMLVSSTAIISALCLVEPRKRLGSIFVILLVLMFVGLSVESFELYSPRWNSYIDSFVKAGTVNTVGRDNAAMPVVGFRDSQVYRTDLASFSRKEKYNQLNYGISDGLNGISSYYSYTSGYGTDFSLSVGNSQQENAFLVTGWAQRTVLNELSSVKYLASYEKDQLKVPKGYSLFETRMVKQHDGSERTAYIYKNESPLPLLFAEANELDAESYDQLATYDKEHALLKGILLDESNGTLRKTVYEPTSLTLLSQEDLIRQLSDVDSNHLEVFPDHIHVKTNNVDVDLQPTVSGDGECYVVFDQMRFEPSKKTVANADNTPLKNFVKSLRGSGSGVSAVSVTALANNKWDSVILLSPSQQYYFGERNVILNLGYGKSASSIRLSFSAAGDYYFSNARIVLQPMDDYEASVDELTRVPVENTQVGPSNISGDVSCSEYMAICCSVPYSQGWTATVNGAKVQVHRANGMYMAVIVPPGQSHVELTYSLPGLRIGLLTSGATLVILTSLVILFADRPILRGSATSHVRTVGTSNRVESHQPSGRHFITEKREQWS